MELIMSGTDHAKKKAVRARMADTGESYTTALRALTETPAAAPKMSHWQRTDGFPSDDYFAAVEEALQQRRVTFASNWRDEDWDYTIELWETDDSDAPPPESGPMSWADHGLYVCWRVDEGSEPRHADDFGDLWGDHGWYWVPHTKPGALGDRMVQFELPYLAEPADVADAVYQLLTVGPAPAQHS